MHRLSLSPEGGLRDWLPLIKGIVLEVSASFPWYTQTIVLISHRLRTKDSRVWTSMLIYFLCVSSRLLLYLYSINSKCFNFINFSFAFSFKKSTFRLWKVYLGVQANTRQDVSLEYNSSSFNFNIHVPFAHPPPFRLINKPLPSTACI